MMKNKEERNFSIVDLSKKGMNPADIGARFDVSASRVHQIIARHRLSGKRRAQLRKKYGVHPEIGELPDNAPLDVLILCDAKFHGWDTRVRHLHHAVKTLGELRRMSDQELLRLPHIGAKMFAQLRLFCSVRNSRYRKETTRGEKNEKSIKLRHSAQRACSDSSE